MKEFINKLKDADPITRNDIIQIIENINYKIHSFVYKHYGIFLALHIIGLTATGLHIVTSLCGCSMIDVSVFGSAITFIILCFTYWRYL